MEVGPQDLLTASATVAQERPKTVILEDITGKRLPHRMVMVGAEVLAGSSLNCSTRTTCESVCCCPT